MRLIHPEETRRISDRILLQSCILFKTNPELLKSAYSLKSSVSLSVFRSFVSALQGEKIKITSANYSGLSKLCDEFGFQSLTAEIFRFFPPKELLESLAAEETPVRAVGFPLRGISSAPFAFVVNGAVIPSEVAVAAALSPAVKEQLLVDSCAVTFEIRDPCVDPMDFRALHGIIEGDVGLLRKSHRQSLISLCQAIGNVGLEQTCLRLLESRAEEVRVGLIDVVSLGQRFDLTTMGDLSMISLETMDEILSQERVIVKSEGALLKALMALGPRYSPLLRHVNPWFLSPKKYVRFVKSWFDVVPPEPICSHFVGKGLAFYLRPAIQTFDSAILQEFPILLSQLTCSPWRLLWRGSRDGFTARAFHFRCEDRRPTVSIMVDQGGFIFGGYTVCGWDKQTEDGLKGDGRQRGFLFTITNPYGVVPSMFPLKQESVSRAIHCDPDSGPIFGFRDLVIGSPCNTGNHCHCRGFGTDYTNTSGLGGSPGYSILFTGKQYFDLREIEVFQIG